MVTLTIIHDIEIRVGGELPEDETGELSSESTGRVPLFTDREKINLEIYSERQNDEAAREHFCTSPGFVDRGFTLPNSTTAAHIAAG